MMMSRLRTTGAKLAFSEIGLGKPFFANDRFWVRLDRIGVDICSNNKTVRSFESTDLVGQVTVERAKRADELPEDMLKRKHKGESPIKLWREHRGMTQEQLADSANLSKSFLSTIESGKRTGTIQTL